MDISKSKAKIIHTRYVIELEHDGCEYHITISNDLKDIFEVDCLKGSHKHGVTELLDVVWQLYMSRKLILGNNY